MTKDTSEEGRYASEGMSRDENGYLGDKCSLLERKIELKNKLIQKYRVNLREMIQAATNILMLTGDEEE